MIRRITPREAYELIARGEVDVVDVREPREWSEGHIEGSRLVPLDRLRASPKGALPRDGVVLVCAAGIRSQTAARIAQANGLSRVYDLAGGTRAWANAGLPLVRDLAAAV
jgi:adenylyltransferase/sulfurtransferase